jgi:hypothetical protein
MQAIIKAQPDLAFLGKTQLKKKLKGQVTAAAIDAYFAQSDVKQLEAQPVKRRRKEFYTITGTPGTFMIDVISVKFKDSNRGEFLLMIDVLSRKCWTLALKQLDDMALVKATLDLIHTIGVEKVTAIRGDNRFAAAAFKETCQALDISLRTEVAASDHISDGNVLGTLDRATRTLKDLLRRWMEANNSVAWVAKLPSLVKLYNSTPISTIDDRTPDDVFADPVISKLQQKEIATARNAKVYASAKHFTPGQKVRILEEKQQFQKSQGRFSREVYTVAKADGFKYLVKDSSGTQLSRRFKSNELLAVSDTAKDVPLPAKVAKAVVAKRVVRKTAAEGIAPHAATLAAITTKPARTRAAVAKEGRQLRPRK